MMMKRAKLWIHKRFVLLWTEIPVLTADERRLIPVSIEVM